MRDQSNRVGACNYDGFLGGADKGARIDKPASNRGIQQKVLPHAQTGRSVRTHRNHSSKLGSSKWLRDLATASLNNTCFKAVDGKGTHPVDFKAPVRPTVNNAIACGEPISDPASSLAGRRRRDPFGFGYRTDTGGIWTRRSGRTRRCGRRVRHQPSGGFR